MKMTPDRVVLKELHRRCRTAGVRFATCEWSTAFRCLCVMLRAYAHAPWRVFEPLRDANGLPRQLNHNDVRKAWEQGMRSSVAADNLDALPEADRLRGELADDLFMERVERGFRDQAAWSRRKVFGADGIQIGGRRDSARDTDFMKCEHGELRQSCQLCNPWRMKQVFRQGCKSGAETNGYLIRDTRRRFDEEEVML